MACEFILSEIRDQEVKDENRYDIFEATVVLEIEGRNVFLSLGFDEVNQ
jgi:hypothetical protein